MAKKAKKTFEQLRSEILMDDSPEVLPDVSPKKLPEKPGKKSDVTDSFYNSQIFWHGGSALVLLIAVLLRFYDLTLKPFHHDEGVNGFFLTTLFRTNVYHYDPQNYHGPTLYFFAQASSYLFGLNDFGVRFGPAIFGVLCVIGILSLRSYLGSIGALSAALLISLSPGMVFISRYFIHEMIFVFFTFGVPLSVIKFMTHRRAGNIAVGATAILLLVCLLPGTLNFANQVGGGDVEIKNIALIVFFIIEAGIVFALMHSLLAWENGRPIYLLLAAASAALTFATKETAFISFGVMMIAIVCIAMLTWANGRPIYLLLAAASAAASAAFYFAMKETGFISFSVLMIAVVCIAIWPKIWQLDKNALWKEPIEIEFKTFRESFTKSNDAILIAILCAVVFAYTSALFFSSFFTYPEGIYGAFEAYAFWTKTGSRDHTQNGLYAYLKWLWTIEAPLLILGAIGALIAFARARHRFAMFAALWAWGLFAAYSIIPYKTPWLAVNFILPLGIIAGYCINELATARKSVWRWAAAFLAIIGFSVAAYQTIDLNFYKYDDDSKPYVYAHSKRDIFNLLKETNRVADVSGKGKDASILIATPEHWPLPWYFKDYSHAAFYGQIMPSENSEIIIGSTTQSAELNREYASRYNLIGTYTLRPGVDLMLYVRKDLTDRAIDK